ILRSGIGGAPHDYLSTAVAEATSSVAVVAYGIAALLGILVAFGIHAAQARAFADRAPAVGVLRAIGAGNRWMRRRLLLESFPLALIAARLVPLTFSPLPFGIDGFALGRISSDIAARGGWRIDPADLNSYNQKLPGFSLLWSAVISVGGLSPLAHVQLIMPLLASLSV